MIVTDSLVDDMAAMPHEQKSTLHVRELLLTSLSARCRDMPHQSSAPASGFDDWGEAADDPVFKLSARVFGLPTHPRQQAELRNPIRKACMVAGQRNHGGSTIPGIDHPSGEMKAG
jgi:hypothetical protein